MDPSSLDAEFDAERAQGVAIAGTKVGTGLWPSVFFRIGIHCGRNLERPSRRGEQENSKANNEKQEQHNKRVRLCSLW